MLNNLFKKQKFEFYSTISGIEHTYPIIPVDELECTWAKESKDNFAKDRKDFTKPKHTATHMCSGIQNLHQQGWVLRSWHDLVIETNGDGQTFSWTTPGSAVSSIMGGDPVSYFSTDRFANFMEIPPNTLKTIVKFNVPWRFHAPKGWGLLMMPLNYTNESRFSSTTGILDPTLSGQLHVISFWHVLKGQTLIKAGTPLCQLIPVKLENCFDADIRSATQKELQYDKFSMITTDSTWVTNKKALVSLYKNTFKRN